MIHHRDNPPRAAWDTMKAHRDLLPADVALEPALSAEFGKNGRLHRLNLAAGVSAIPDAARGPQIVLHPPYGYHTKGTGKTKGGVLIPITMVPLFTDTAKMSCPSFSLPAGPVPNGGTCPMSRLESVLGPKVRQDPDVRAQLAFAERTNDKGRLFSDAVYLCDGCYAGKGNYVKYPLTAIRQSIRLAWVNATLGAAAPLDFASQMIQAIAYMRALPVKTQARHRLNTHYFRIHDSGDFWRTDYYLAWREVCLYFNRPGRRVIFWAPTRMWASPAWRRTFAQAPPPANLILRPSALFFGAPAPALTDGYAQGSTATATAAGSLRGWKGGALPRVRTDQTWDCPAYHQDAGTDKSCAGAKCRVCWTRPDVAVSYAEH